MVHRAQLEPKVCLVLRAWLIVNFSVNSVFSVVKTAIEFLNHA